MKLILFFPLSEGGELIVMLKGTAGWFQRCDSIPEPLESSVGIYVSCFWKNLCKSVKLEHWWMSLMLLIKRKDIQFLAKNTNCQINWIHSKEGKVGNIHHITAVDDTNHAWITDLQIYLQNAQEPQNI